MHDGRFYTLEAVLRHYNESVIDSPTLDASLKKGIQTTTDEQRKLISFLKTLTDNEFLKNKRFAAP